MLRRLLLHPVIQPAASRAADARRAIARIQSKIAFGNRNHDTRLEHQQRADRGREHDTPAP